MQILIDEKIKALDATCQQLVKLEEVLHVGVINRLGNLIAGDTKKGSLAFLDNEQLRMVYMQLQLDFQMRKELDDILGPIDYIASRRKNLLVISVPIGENLVLITAEPNADDKRIIKRAEELFDDITITTVP